LGLYCDIIRLKDENIRKAAELKDKTEELYSFIQNTESDNWFELDKAWHGIHFLLTGKLKEQAAGFLINEGSILRAYNWMENYGVDVTDMRSFTPDEVIKINNILTSKESGELKKYYDPAEMHKNNIYPGIWEKKEFFTSHFIAKHFKISPRLDYLINNYEKLRIFINDTTKKEMGLIIKYHQ